MNSKPLIRTTLATSAIVFRATAVSALDPDQISTPITNVICGIFKVFWGLATAIAALVFIIAIIQFIYNRDDPGKRKQAKTIMIAAVIGLILAALTVEIIGGIAPTSWNIHPCKVT